MRSKIFATAALTGALMLCGTTHATGELAKALGKPNSTQSPYELLKEKFDAAEPAKISDLPTIEDVKAGKTQPLNSIKNVDQNTKESDVSVGLLTVYISRPITTKPATPAKGPLFPAEPAEVRYRAVIGGTPDLESLKKISEEQIIQYLTTHDMEVTETSEGVIMTGESSKIVFKKSGQLFFSRAILQNGTDAYNYMWP